MTPPLIILGTSLAISGVGAVLLMRSLRRPKPRLKTTNLGTPAVGGFARKTGSPHLGTPFKELPPSLFGSEPRVGRFVDYDSDLEFRGDYVALVPEGTPGATGYIIPDEPRFYVRLCGLSPSTPQAQHRQYWLFDRQNPRWRKLYTRKANALRAAKRCNDALVT